MPLWWRVEPFFGGRLECALLKCPVLRAQEGAGADPGVGPPPVPPRQSSLLLGWHAKGFLPRPSQNQTPQWEEGHGQGLQARVPSPRSPPYRWEAWGGDNSDTGPVLVLRGLPASPLREHLLPHRGQESPGKKGRCAWGRGKRSWEGMQSHALQGIIHPMLSEGPSDHTNGLLSSRRLATTRVPFMRIQLGEMLPGQRVEPS